MKIKERNKEGPDWRTGSLHALKSKQIDLISCLEGSRVEMKLIDVSQVTRLLYTNAFKCASCPPPPALHPSLPPTLTRRPACLFIPR